MEKTGAKSQSLYITLDVFATSERKADLDKHWKETCFK